MLRLSQSITTSTEIRSPSHRHKFDSKFHPGKGRKPVSYTHLTLPTKA